MPAAASSWGSVSRLNWGLWRERGTVRTPATRGTAKFRRSPIKISSGRVECPMVRSTGGWAVPAMAWGVRPPSGDRAGGYAASGLQGLQVLGQLGHRGQEIPGGVGSQGLKEQPLGVDAGFGEQTPGPLHPPESMFIA